MSGQISFKVFSKLTEKTGTNISLDNLSKIKRETVIVVFAPVDLVFTGLDKDVFNRLAKLSNGDLKELLNLHIIVKQEVRNGITYLSDTTGNEYSFIGNKFNNIPIIPKSFNIGNINIIPISAINVNQKLLKLLTSPKVTIQEENRISQLLRLPKEILRMTALNLPNHDLRSLCQGSKELNNRLCADEVFWREKVRREFPNTIYPKPNDLSWKNYYKYLLDPGDELNLSEMLLRFYNIDPDGEYTKLIGAPPDNVGLFSEHIYRALQRINQIFRTKRRGNIKYIIKFKRINASEIDDPGNWIRWTDSITKREPEWVKIVDKIISRGYDAEPIIAKMVEGRKYTFDTDVYTTAIIFTYLKYKKPLPILTWEIVPENSPYGRGYFVFDE